MIHPSAVVDPRAEIGEDVEIGPCVVIDGPAKVGARTRLVAFVHVSGHTEIGADNVIHPFAVVGHEPQHLGYRGEPTRLYIGDRNIIREHAEIHRGTPQGTGETRIGHDNLIMGHAHVAHDCRIANKVTLVNGALLGGHAEVHDGAFVSGNVVVHQHARIGKLAIVQGLGGIGKDVLPYAMASGIDTIAGTNIVGLRRAGFDSAARERIRGIYRLFFRMPITDAVAEAERVEPCAELAEMVRFIAETKRGICRFGRKQSTRRLPLRHAMDSDL
ncbi:MAG: acyl-ACP--UDP-N-acetylglucosamine O-acyltransferase [Planctomycetes bacterium]|nr:acyl-ACP--UDP-N-acetylglucosamine O-acyltransferase [Planctomycetota bacterium]